MRVSCRWMVPGLAIAVLAIGSAVAQDDGFPRGGGHGRDMVSHMTKVLGLTDDQSSRIQVIVDTYTKGSLGEKMKAMGEARGALDVAIHDPSRTDQQILEAAKDVSSLDASLAVERHHMAGEISAVLTPEQRAKLTTIAHDHMAFRRSPPPDGPDGF